MNTIKFEKGNTLVVAHRGLSGIEKENTCSAFVAAANRSYFGIEADIHRTADGHFVINHDMNLDRVSGEDISIDESTLSTLQNVILFDTDGTKGRADLRPCTLENYISICKKYEKHCILELKSDFTDDEIKRIIDIITELDYIDNVTFIAFNYGNLVKIREVLPSQRVQYLVFEITDEIMDKLISDGVDANAKFDTLTKEHIDKLHNAGLKVNCWTVNDKSDAEHLVKMGVDYITTNILE